MVALPFDAAGNAVSDTGQVANAMSIHNDTIREVLPNGLTLLVRRDTSAPVVSIVTHVNAGYFDETDDIVGIAHVLEHMFFKGTPTRGVGEIARETKGHGGYLNAHTIYDHTRYYTVLPSRAFTNGLDIQFDAYARSLIDSGELASELEVIIQEAMRKLDNPPAVAIESLFALLYDQHRIRRWRIGEAENLRTFTSEKLLAFYRYWYRPSNTILAIVGDVDPDMVRREVATRHGSLPNEALVREPAPLELAHPEFRMRDWSGDLIQQQLAFGWRTPGVSHPDSAALDLAGVTLGTGRSSRLYRGVRERKLVSSVSSWNYPSKEVGVFVLHAEAPAEHAHEAALSMWREVQAARQHGFNAGEVMRAQRVTEAGWLRGLETMDGQANYLAEWEAEGGLQVAANYYDRLLSLGTQDLHEVLERYLEPSLASVISYRPHDASQLAADADSLREALSKVETIGSAVMPASDVIEAEKMGHGDKSSATVTGVEEERVEFGVHVFRTRGNVPVLVIPRPGATMLHVGVFQRGGATKDPHGMEGLARLTAQSMIKGTSKYSALQFAEATEALGGSVAVNTGLEAMSWSLSVPLRHFESAVSLLGEVVQRPVFPAEALETERALALAAASHARDDMYRWPMKLAASAAYGSHPYARSVIGTEESLTSIDLSSVLDFYRRHIAEGETAIALIGDVMPDDAARAILSEFDELICNETEPVDPVTWPSQGLGELEVRDRQQSAIAMLYPGPSMFDLARYTARVLSAITSGLGGRFFEQLRDVQSLAYTVSAFPVERTAGGAFAAYIATSPEREEEALAGLKSEFAKLREAAPSDEELDRAKRYLVGTHAIRRQSGASVLGEAVDCWLFGRDLSELQLVESRINAVSPTDILALARQYFVQGSEVTGIVRGKAKVI